LNLNNKLENKRTNSNKGMIEELFEKLSLFVLPHSKLTKDYFEICTTFSMLEYKSERNELNQVLLSSQKNKKNTGTKYNRLKPLMGR